MSWTGSCTVPYCVLFWISVLLSFLSLLIWSFIVRCISHQGFFFILDRGGDSVFWKWKHYLNIAPNPKWLALLLTLKSCLTLDDWGKHLTLTTLAKDESNRPQNPFLVLGGKTSKSTSCIREVVWCRKDISDREELQPFNVGVVLIKSQLKCVFSLLETV